MADQILKRILANGRSAIKRLFNGNHPDSEPNSTKADDAIQNNAAPDGLDLKAAASEKEDMVLTWVESGETVHYETSSYSTEKVKWVSKKTDENGKPVAERQPVEVTTTCTREEPFTVAGKRYPDFDHFLKSKKGFWARDLYGRKVFCTKQKFPCFDSFDSMYEHRYFRWYFIRQGNTLSQVYVADERETVYVTEDVENVEWFAWRRLEDVGFCRVKKKS